MTGSKTADEVQQIAFASEQVRGNQRIVSNCNWGSHGCPRLTDDQRYINTYMDAQLDKHIIAVEKRYQMSKIKKYQFLRKEVDEHVQYPVIDKITPASAHQQRLTKTLKTLRKHMNRRRATPSPGRRDQARLEVVAI